MSKLAVIVLGAALAVPAWHACAAAPQPKAGESPRAAFIKKCFRDQTKRSCTAPPQARVSPSRTPP